MIPEALLTALRSRLATVMGLCLSGRGWADLERRIGAAAEDAGHTDSTAYVRILLADGVPKSEVERLAEHLTVGETYFFRERGGLDALEAHVLPDLLRRRGTGNRSLRIWSAGCCTGEEAYSIAMVLDRLLPEQTGWDIRIHGTDINPRFLHVAREAVYSEWAFRTTPDWVQRLYFERTDDNRYALATRIRDRVRFSYCNLATNDLPDTDFDLILCRNVLMYFTAENAGATAARLHRALRPDGLLLVSPAETSVTVFKQFSCVNYPGAIFYSPTRPKPSAKPPLPARRRSTSRRAPQRRNPPPPVDGATMEATARRHADRGELDAAASCCLEAIAADKLSARLYYLLANIELERGNVAAAATALQRTVFVDPSFVLAHFALINLRLREGRNRDAARQLNVTRTLLARYDRYAALPESDGLTAGRLRTIIDTLDGRLERGGSR